MEICRRKQKCLRHNSCTDTLQVSTQNDVGGSLTVRSHCFRQLLSAAWISLLLYTRNCSSMGVATVEMDITIALQPCDACTNLIQELALDRWSPSKRVQHKAPRAFAAAANDGCPLCTRIWYGLVLRASHIEMLINHSYSGRIGDPSTKAVTITIGAGTMFINSSGIFRAWTQEEMSINLGRNMMIFHLDTPIGVPPDIGEVRMRLPPAGTMIDASLHYVSRFASKWLSQCKEHRKCVDFQSSTWLPKRLVEVLDCHSRFRVVQPHNVAAVAPYFTLSYCWDDAKFLQLQACCQGNNVSRVVRVDDDSCIIYRVVKYKTRDSLSKRYVGKVPLYTALLLISILNPPLQLTLCRLTSQTGRLSIFILCRNTCNESQLEQGMDITVLPKTFQDAIAICQSLSIRYIWIDSLCIVQDDKDEWSQQSKAMSMVYENAQCNIAANNAGCGPHGGIFSDGFSPGTFMPVHIRIGPMHEVRYNEAIGRVPSFQPGDYELVQYEDFSLVVTSEHLGKRGWVFQERILARSVLHFTENGLHWECNELVASATQPNGFPRSQHHRNISEALDAGGLEAASTTECGPNCVLCERWASLISMYTEKELTYPNDRPMAIAGLAKRLASITGDQYVAGSWRKHLRRQLGWELGPRDPSQQPYKASDLSRMPSFSWLSRDAEIKWSPYVAPTPEKWWTIEEIHVEDLHVTSEGVPTQVGWLQISAFLKPVCLELSDGSTETFISWNVTPRDHRDPSYWHAHSSGVVDYDRQGLPLAGSSDEHFFMPYSGDQSSVMFFILKLIEGAKAKYRRIGRYQAWFKTAFHSPEDRLQAFEILKALGFQIPHDSTDDDLDLSKIRFGSDDEMQTFNLV